ncbi:MAG TPA: adenosine-specific kinase [Syntrophorhabdales bacterium]|nr:adenosine-specific kinase [Syntrophorhabdales bacterium]
MELKTIKVAIPQGLNVIIGQSHFIKTIEDLYEILVSSSSSLKFGVAFSEASTECLVRHEGNDPELEMLAADAALSLSCGHIFVIFLKDGFPINVLNAVKACQEVCHIFCATANPLEVIVASSEQGNGIMGVIDGSKPQGIETEENRQHRKELLRKFKYKL